MILKDSTFLVKIIENVKNYVFKRNNARGLFGKVGQKHVANAGSKRNQKIAELFEAVNLPMQHVFLDGFENYDVKTNYDCFGNDIESVDIKVRVFSKSTKISFLSRF